MESIDILILTRSLERITAALLGGGAIYLAYAIFTRLPDLSQLADNFKFRQYLQLHFVKVAAGTILLIFGGFVILATVLKTVTLSRIDPDDPSGDSKDTIYSGVTPADVWIVETLELIDTSVVIDNFRTLDTLHNLLRPDLDGPTQFAVRQTATRTRLYLMLAIWDKARWGDKIAFREWVINGQPTKVPAAVKPAAIRFFRGQSNTY